MCYYYSMTSDTTYRNSFCRTFYKVASSFSWTQASDNLSSDNLFFGKKPINSENTRRQAVSKASKHVINPHGLRDFFVNPGKHRFTKELITNEKDVIGRSRPILISDKYKNINSLNLDDIGKLHNVTIPEQEKQKFFSSLQESLLKKQRRYSAGRIGTPLLLGAGAVGAGALYYRSWKKRRKL